VSAIFGVFKVLFNLHSTRKGCTFWSRHILEAKALDLLVLYIALGSNSEPEQDGAIVLTIGGSHSILDWFA
jgi:hypothetical protein